MLLTAVTFAQYITMFRQQLQQLRAKLAQSDIDGAIISDVDSVYYFCRGGPHRGLERRPGQGMARACSGVTQARFQNCTRRAVNATAAARLYRFAGGGGGGGGYRADYRRDADDQITLGIATGAACRRGRQCDDGGRARGHKRRGGANEIGFNRRG